MNTKELLSNLSQFIGTEKYYRITHRHLLTDGTKYLAENAECFWLMTAIASHLPKQFHDYFAVVNLTVKNSAAQLTLDDGNENVFAPADCQKSQMHALRVLRLCCRLHWCNL